MSENEMRARLVSAEKELNILYRERDRASRSNQREYAAKLLYTERKLRREMLALRAELEARLLIDRRFSLN
jgi:hypothetical protein